MNMNVTAVCRAGYNQLRQLRSVARSLSAHATKTLVQAFICSFRVAWTTVTRYFTALTTGYFAACSRCRTLQHAW